MLSIWCSRQDSNLQGFPMDPKSIACTNFATGARRKRELDPLYSFYQITATEKEKNDIFYEKLKKDVSSKKTERNHFFSV